MSGMVTTKVTTPFLRRACAWRFRARSVAMHTIYQFMSIAMTQNNVTFQSICVSSFPVWMLYDLNTTRSTAKETKVKPAKPTT